MQVSGSVEDAVEVDVALKEAIDGEWSACGADSDVIVPEESGCLYTAAGMGMRQSRGEKKLVDFSVSQVRSMLELSDWLSGSDIIGETAVQERIPDGRFKSEGVALC